MIIIRKKLNFELYKDSTLTIEKKGIEYSRNNDKILFELDEEVFEILLLEEDLKFEKKNKNAILNINKNEATIKLNDYNFELPLKVEYFDTKFSDNVISINYKLESDDELTRINIIL